MPLSGLIATSEFAPEARYRGQGRRAPQDPPGKAEARGPAAAPGQPFDPAYYAGRFKTDLSQLQTFDGARETPNPANVETDQKLFDFFGNLSVLLLAVRAGDIARAQAAADALEMEVLVERSAGRRPGALFSAAPSHDEDAARFAAEALASDVQNAAAPAPIPPPDPYAEATRPDDGGAAYDTLTQYLSGGGGAV